MRFIHTADWQVGKPFAGIADQHKRSLLQRERVEVIKRIGAVALESGAEFVLVAGDLFDSPRADKATVSVACSAIGQIGLPVVVVPGNHDNGGPGSVWTQEFFLREQAALAPNLSVLLEAVPCDLGSAGGRDDEGGDGAPAGIVDLERIPDREVDYIALGDWHGTKQVGPKAGYAGNPEPDRLTKGGGHDIGNIRELQQELGGTRAEDAPWECRSPNTGSP